MLSFYKYTFILLYHTTQEHKGTVLLCWSTKHKLSLVLKF